VLDHALAGVNGNTSDTDSLMKALKAAKVPNAPRGPLSFDSYGGPVQNIYIRRVEDARGHLENVVIKTYPQVSQFWTYDAKAYLSHPVYSRTYPACNACQ